MEVYDTIRKFVKEVAKAGCVSDIVMLSVMVYIRTQEERYPQPTRQELLGMMINIENTIRNHTKAFVSFDVFPNYFVAAVVYNINRKDKEWISILCSMEGEMEVEENHIHTGLKIFNRPDKEICPIEEAPLKERTKRLLINTRGLKDISELRQFTKWQILSWRGVGDVTLNDIVFCMRRYDLMFKDDCGAYPMNVIAELFPRKSFGYRDGVWIRYQQMLRYHLEIEEQLAIERIYKLGEYHKTDDPIWEPLKSSMTKLGLPHILNYILEGKIESGDTFPWSIDDYYPPCSYHPCLLCNHHYRRRGKHRKYGKDDFCDLTNEYVGCRSAEELGCEHFESIYERKKSDGKNN